MGITRCSRAIRHPVYPRLFDSRLDDQRVRSSRLFFDSSNDRLNVEERRRGVPSHFTILSNDFVSHATFLQTFVFQRSVPISWSVYGVYTELACCFRDFVRHRGCKPILEGKWKTNIDGDGWFSLRVYFPFSKLKKKKSRSIFNHFGIFYQVNNRRVTDKEEANKLIWKFV